jgi:CSLREA domain-containing protein
MKFLRMKRDWKEGLSKKSILPQTLPLFSEIFKTVFLLSVIFASANIYAATFTVNTTLDNESDGCGVGQCTLREAITAANATLIVADTINFAPGVTGTISLNGNNLSITSDITINGPGARNLTVSANNLSRVFVVRGLGTEAVISGLTIADGNAAVLTADGITLSGGGGILVTNGGDLTLTESTVRNCHTTTFGGGVATNAILLTISRTNIIRSTIRNNTATLGGAGVSNVGIDLVSSAVTTIANSTITNNTALAEGGGLSNTLGDMHLINNTISDNQSVVAGGGVVSVTVPPIGSTTVRNNIIARNSAVVGTDLISSDVLGIFISRGNNLIGNNLNAEVSFAIPNANGDIVGSVAVGFEIIYPLIGPLRNNGGPTDTRQPLVNSPALDAGNNCVTNNSCGANNPPSPLTTDQRGAGFPRIANGTVDIGATEGPAAPNPPYVVNTLADNESDGCGVGFCTLREAVNASNVNPDFDTINFAPGLTGTIFLSGTQLIVTGNTTINGPGARVLTVSGSNISRVFLIAAPILGGDFEVEISGLTITQGHALPVLNLAGDGGGILNGALLGLVSGRSHLTLREVNISGNLATTLGGGVATRLGSETLIINSLISHNICNAVPILPTDDVGGGGVSNAVLSTTTIANTTIANNETLGAGGGILNVAGQMHLTNNTITGNESTLLGGGVVSLVGVVPPLGVVNLRNTIIAENHAVLGTDLISSDVLGVLGSLNSLGHNLIGNNVNVEIIFAASVFVGTSPLPNAQLDLVGSVGIDRMIINPQLGPLQDNGGPTDSRLPSTSSPAMNAGDNCVFTNTCPVNPQGLNPHAALLTDQRIIFSRLINTAVEIGSVEVPLAPTAAEVSVSGRILDGNGRGLYRAIVTLTDSNGNTFTSTTNPFGYYRLSNITAGDTVVILPASKGYEFSPQIITLEDDMVGLDISALTSNSKSGARPR